MVSKKRYQELKAAGKCVKCGEDRGSSSSTVRCQPCHDTYNKARLTKAAERKAAALCLQCGANQSIGNSNYCNECRQKNTEAKKNLSSKKITAFKENNNICKVCKGPVDAFRIVCGGCLKKTTFTKIDAIQRYGGQCLSCNNSDIKSLCIVSSDISKPLKDRGKPLYKIICYSTKPPAQYQVLCSSCYWDENMDYICDARRFYDLPKHFQVNTEAQDKDIIDI